MLRLASLGDLPNVQDHYLIADDPNQWAINRDAAEFNWFSSNLRFAAPLAERESTVSFSETAATTRITAARSSRALGRLWRGESVWQ
jgi:hypothetical protein